MSSPFDLESLNLLYRLKIFDTKIPSGEINNYFLLKNIAKKSKRIFISSGMSTLFEVSQAIKILINNALNIYGSSLAGMGKLIQRNDLRLMYRKFSFEQEVESPVVS